MRKFYCTLSIDTNGNFSVFVVKAKNRGEAKRLSKDTILSTNTIIYSIVKIKKSQVENLEKLSQQN